MHRRAACLLTTLACAAAGCGWFGSEQDDAPDIPLPVATPAPTAEADRLELKLEVGDRFPLMKTVAQELHQASAVGSEQSRSKLELLLTIAVEKVEPERKLLSVRYNRVRYWQDVADESFEFDSSRVGAAVPKAALPYQGLVGNGFSFWIGPDNQVLEPVGFAEFLERCVRDVPVEDRQSVLRRFARTTADEGIANFVDDSIGLLPYGVDGKESGGRVVEGDTWTRERRLMQPVPIYLKNRYTLRSLTESTAEIDILGNISPASTDQSAGSAVVPAAGEAEADDPATEPDTPQVLVRGGNAYGSCTIDRATGLPLRSHVDRFLNMTVRLPNGLEFEQRKRTTTTIQAFPQQSTLMEPGSDRGSAVELRSPEPAASSEPESSMRRL